MMLAIVVSLNQHVHGRMLACFAEIIEGLEQLVLGAAAEEEIHNAKMSLNKHLQVGAYVLSTVT